MTLSCPKCQADMRTYERNGVHVDQCTECRGIFLDRGELEKLVDAENSWHGEDSAPAAGQPADPDVRRDPAPTTGAGAGPADTPPGSAPAAGAAGGGLGAIVGEVLQQVKAAKSSGSQDRGYDRGGDRGGDRGYGGSGYGDRDRDRGYGDRGYGDRGYGDRDRDYDPRYGKPRKKKSFLDELFG